eukprot:3293042-Pleurochrysis_carterae.AAC.1
MMAASEAAKEAIYLRSLVAELGSPAAEPTSLALDNKSAIDLAYIPEYHARITRDRSTSIVGISSSVRKSNHWSLRCLS